MSLSTLLHIWFSSLVFIFINSNIEIQSNAEFTSRIVNGTPCKISDHPYMANLLRTKSMRHFCGGSILSEIWVLTAAHCIPLNHYKPGSFTVVAGLTYSVGRRRSDFENYAQKSPVIKTYRTSSYYYNDIGLLKLYRPLIKTKVVQFVKLATSLTQPIEQICKNATVIGWGDQYAKDSAAEPLLTPKPPYYPRLLCVNIPVISNEECEKQYFYVSPAFLCAYAQSRDACQGDSGGPLVCNGVQYGIVASGRGCAYMNYPGIYTRVDYNIDFIREIMSSTGQRFIFLNRYLVLVWMMHITLVKQQIQL